MLANKYGFTYVKVPTTPSSKNTSPLVSHDLDYKEDSPLTPISPLFTQSQNQFTTKIFSTCNSFFYYDFVVTDGKKVVGYLTNGVFYNFFYIY